jgi:DNA-binding NtrC family response regulator
MRLGAADYLAKPFEPEELILAFLRCRGVRAAARREEKRADEDARKTEGFLFSQGLAALRAQVETVLEAERRLENNLPPMLIERETGTGNPACRRRFAISQLLARQVDPSLSLVKTEPQGTTFRLTLDI